MNKSFGEYIRFLRNGKQLTLTKLAAKLDMDSANLCKVENGKRDFDEKKLNKLSKIFNLKLSEVRHEYWSGKIAKEIYIYDNSSNILRLAEEKIKYYRSLK